MHPIVYILHSESGNFSASLVTNAIMCVRAMCNTVCAHSPDFIPPCAILRADPVVGVQYIYSTAIPDGNHAISSSYIYSVLESLPLSSPSSLSLASLPSSSLAPSRSERSAKDVPAALIARSASYIADNTICGTCSLAENKTDSLLLKEEKVINANEDTVENNRSSSMTYSSEKLSKDDTRDTWACLAGALLTALCFLHKHQLMTAITDDKLTSHAENTFVNNATDNTNGGCIIIFSDSGDNDVTNSTITQQRDEAWTNYQNVTFGSALDMKQSTRLSFSTECAFANVAVCLSKTSFTLHCFSKSVFASLHWHERRTLANLHQEQQQQQHHQEKGNAANFKNKDANCEAASESCENFYTTGASRVCALVNSLNGICAPEFTFAHLGRLFAIHSSCRDNNDYSDKITGEAEQKRMIANNTNKNENELSTFTRRGRRERMAEQYVVTPTVLPQSSERSKENVCGNLAWLCPRCMAIVEHTDRDTLEAKDNIQQVDTVDDRNDGDNAECCKTCPYCANA